MAIRGRASGNTDYNFGIYGKACNNNGKGYAIYGEAEGAGALWAGWFDGDVYHTGSWPTPSDSNLKTDIAEFSEALGTLSALQPVSYEFKVDQNPSLNLASGQHFGFLAQQVQEILPHLVKQARNMTKMDEAGIIEYDPVEFLGLNYIGLIPLIVGALNERQDIIDVQTQQIVKLQAAINQLLTQMGEK